MKIKDGFVLREAAGSYVVMNIGGELSFNGMITLNATAKTLWLALEKGADEDELVGALMSEYDVDEDRARKATVDFVAKLKELDFLA